MKQFLNKYDTLVLDMDGVITSESGYWDAAALTVYEYLFTKEHFGSGDIDVEYMSENCGKIRNEIYLNDKLIKVFKDKGVNSNWDLGYITVLAALMLDTRDMDEVYEFAQKIDEDIITVYESLAKAAAKKQGYAFEEFKRNGKLWTAMRDSFQEWYLGDDRFTEVYGREPETCGKGGIYKKEKPLFSLEKLRPFLRELAETKRLCVGTGRQYIEIVPLLEMWDVADCFDSNGICDYSYVSSAERKIGATLAKPHPYTFLKALYGTDYSDEKIVDGEYDKSKTERTLIVGDAGADILAAKAMGSDFCAVLTGVAGKSGKKYFEEQNAEYILDTVLDMREGV